MKQRDKSGCLGIFLSLFGVGGNRGSGAGSKESLVRFPYGLRDAFLSPAEISFFHVLRGVLEPGQYLIAKVNLADLFYVKQPHLNRSALNRIDRKHVDFVICDAGTMQPVLAIELDDSSHQRKDRKERDAMVDQVFAAAGLPLLHVPAARAYQPEILKQAIQEARMPARQ